MIEATAIIPAHNLSHVTIRCIDHLMWYAKDFVKVLYYDNGSADWQFDAVQARLKQSGMDHEIVRYDENMHFTYAVNAGWVRSTELGLIPVVLNNDCFVTKHCLQNMCWHITNRPRVAAVCPLTDGPGVCTIKRGPTRGKRFGRALLALPDWDRAAFFVQRNANEHEFAKSDAPFFCTAINPDALQEVGLMAERYQNGLWADTHWTMRARRMRWQTGIAADAFAIHKGRRSFRVLNIPRKITRK